MTNRILINSGGLKITKPTYDVLTETDQGKLAFNSDYAGLGIRQTGSLSLGAGATTSVSITNLGFIPHVWACYLKGGLYTLPWFTATTSSGGNSGDGLTYTVGPGDIAFTNPDPNNAITAIYYVVFHKAA